MVKLKSDPITKEDISEYLERFSDFSFEIKVLRKLSSLGFSCEHSGTYEDPVTKRTREFDIRARKTLIEEQNVSVELSLSVECKNLKDNFPLVIHCMPRDEHECYLDLIWSSEPLSYIPVYENSMRVPLEGDNCPYEKLTAVGKSTDQVGRKESQGSDLVGNDGDVFDKISQAINSSYDLLEEAHYASTKEKDVVSLVIPVLVVPDNRIWSVCYKRTGEIEREPTLENNLEYYIGKSWLVGNSPNEYQRRYYLSHLEVVQIGSLFEMVNKYTTLTSISSFNELNMNRLQALESRAI
ncbi:hypothetical protein [Thiococcus pfennigii]|uniref:hypothetical protein n=1 Tax=Thiococcus pfennigii TaxID=1057 RepID=UPI0019073287|nr:hypothetical protein [Thiococcus pfennigii]